MGFTKSFSRAGQKKKTTLYVHWLVFHLVLPTEMDSETGRLGGVKKILSTDM